MRILLLCLTLATPAAAQNALTPEEFEALVEGKTLDFGYMGQKPYGMERYLPDRQVFWSWRDNLCEQGHWYPDEGNICFVYDSEPRPQCWRYFNSDGKLYGVFMNEGADPSVMYELTPLTKDLVCDNFGT